MGALVRNTKDSTIITDWNLAISKRPSKVPSLVIGAPFSCYRVVCDSNTRIINRIL